MWSDQRSGVLWRRGRQTKISSLKRRRPENLDPAKEDFPSMHGPDLLETGELDVKKKGKSISNIR